MAELRRGCELCDAEAYVYCPSDGAFLCGKCDEKVHCVNFLVARHVRVRVCCPQCKLHVGKSVSSVKGPLSGNMNVIGCHLCSPNENENEEYEDDCLSSSCVSSTGEEAEVGVTSSSSHVSRRKRINRMKNRVDTKVEGILVNWCRDIGVEDIMVAQTAVELINNCLGKMTILPLRVSLAVTFYAAIKLHGGISDPHAAATCQMIKRLEKISGVPAKLIVAMETRIASRLFKRKQLREDHEEGWAEC